MRVSRHRMLFLAVCLNVLLICRPAPAQDVRGDALKDDVLQRLRDELLDISKTPPACMVDEGGLPKRVIITRNGSGLFARPEEGAERLRTLSMNQRMYLYVQDDGRGFHRVGGDPWAKAPTGWVPSAFAMVWDHNEMLFFNGESVPSDTNRIHVWKTEEEAREGDADKAIYAEDVVSEPGKLPDIFFPVLEKDRTGTLYKIGFVFGGEQGALDQYGQQLTPQQRKSIAENVSVANVMLVIDATGSMSAFIEEAKTKATEVVDELEKRFRLTSVADQEKIDLTVNFGMVAYRDKGDAFEVKTFLPATNDRGRIRSQIAALDAGGGGDFPEMVIEAVREALKDPAFAQGALNRIILIGDAPPHDQKDETLSGLGADAKAQLVQIFALTCGDSELTAGTFEMIASSSGGETRKLAEASQLVDEIVEDLKERLRGVPLETKLASDLAQGRTLRESAQEMGMSDRQARQMHRLLIARGADVGPSGVGFREGWVKVRPGTEGRFRVHAYMARYQLAAKIAQMLGITQETAIEKNLTENSKALIQLFLENVGGDKAAAGIEKEGRTIAERGQGIPEGTVGIRRGAAGVKRYTRAYQQKIRNLLPYWRDESKYVDDHIWVPVDLLP